MMFRGTRRGAFGGVWYSVAAAVVGTVAPPGAVCGCERSVMMEPPPLSPGGATPSGPGGACAGADASAPIARSREICLRSAFPSSRVCEPYKICVNKQGILTVLHRATIIRKLSSAK